jgi:threonyl-tRNA synthetase
MEFSLTCQVFVQDDAHIFCLPNQIEAEILGVLHLTEVLLTQFGFQDFEARCCIRQWKGQRCRVGLFH